MWFAAIMGVIAFAGCTEPLPAGTEAPPAASGNANPLFVTLLDLNTTWAFPPGSDQAAAGAYPEDVAFPAIPPNTTWVVFALKRDVKDCPPEHICRVYLAAKQDETRLAPAASDFIAGADEARRAYVAWMFGVPDPMKPDDTKATKSGWAVDPWHLACTDVLCNDAPGFTSDTRVMVFAWTSPTVDFLDVRAAMDVT